MKSPSPADEQIHRNERATFSRRVFSPANPAEAAEAPGEIGRSNGAFPRAINAKPLRRLKFSRQHDMARRLLFVFHGALRWGILSEWRFSRR
jgi:hypothetical protein